MQRSDCPEARTKHLAHLAGPREGLSRHFSIPSAKIFHRLAVRNSIKFLLQKFPNIHLVLCCFAIAACVTQRTDGPGPEAQIRLHQARRSRVDAKTAIGYYLDAADTALNSAKSSFNTFSPDCQRVYNNACQEIALLLQTNPALWNRNETISTDRHTYRLLFTSGSRQGGIWDPSYLDYLHDPQQLHGRFRLLARCKSCWGGALVGVHKPADPRKYFLPPDGLAVSVTATVDFNPVDDRNRDHTLDARFTLYDPRKRETIRIDGAKRPLAADFTATYSYYPDPFLLGVKAMLRPASHRQRAGLYLLEPYDPKQIPVVFVHGLMSAPQMWVPTINAIDADPDLRGRFQFWVFAYPTGDPILLSALRLRESIAGIYHLYPKTRGMILVGHSMGGIVSRLQAVTTGRLLWDAIFKTDANRLYAALPPDDLLKRALIFKANHHVKRIVFFCVPHRGSYLATNWIGALGVSLIRFPSTFLGNTAPEIMASLESNAGLKRLPTGINDLSPQSLVLISLNGLSIQAPYHSIIANRGRADSPNSSDGVVPYWSSHLKDAQSELIVPGSHGAYALPQTVAELKRILRLHLADSDSTRPSLITRRSEESIEISKTK
jgi:pimeloyl-ACP methyl ester carboxylesterase